MSNKKEEAEKKKREKAEADAKKKADKAAAAEAKKAAGAAARAPRVQKTVLGQFQENVAKAQKFMNRAGASFKAWSTLAAAAPGTMEDNEILKSLLATALVSATEISPRLIDLKDALESLVKEGFVPGTAPRGPKFAVGEVVRIDDEWMPKYTKSGFYKTEELSLLTIVAIGEKEVLTKTANGREVTVRAMAHLEATSLEDATAPATEPTPEGAAA